MFDSQSHITGLEIGTSKICAVVGEINESGVPSIIGIGQAASRGVRKGEVVDPVLVAEDVRAALADAENHADKEIRSVYLGVSGAHITSKVNRGIQQITGADQEVIQEDVDDVVKNAKSIRIAPQEKIIHAIRQDFILDGQGGVPNPVGMHGSRLEVEMHVILGNDNRLQNTLRVVDDLHINIEGVVFNGLASSLALLGHEQKEMGALVVDIGGGVTDYVVYIGGIVKHAGVLAVGGDHVTSDLAYGLNVPLGRAEELKISNGSAVMRSDIKGQTLSLNNGLLPSKTVSLDHIHCIMSLRLEEIFQIIETDLSHAGLLDYIRGGVYLSGGGSRIANIEQCAENVFQMPVMLGAVNAINGADSALDHPEFTTAIGLLKYGSFQQKRPKGILDAVRGKLGEMIHGR